MLPSDSQLRLLDIRERIDRIMRYTSGMSWEAFDADELVTDAVLYNFIVIGEAARFIPTETETRFPELPVNDMRAMRNVIIHEYQAVELLTIWETIQNDLPALMRALDTILNTFNGLDRQHPGL